MADPQPTQSRDGWTVITSAVIAVTLLRLASVYIPFNRIWGLDYIRYIPLWVTLATSVISFILLVPSIRDGVVSWYEALDEKRLKSTYVTIAIVTGVAILLFPMETFFLGDGGLFIGEVYKAVQTDGFVSMRILDLKSAPLEGIVLYAITYTLPDIAQSLGMQSGFDPMFPFRMVSLVAYMAAVLAIFNIVESRQRIPALLFLMGTAGSLLFFGYVEMYAFVIVALAVFLLVSMKYCYGTASRRAVVIAYCIALLSHYYSIALLPAFLFLLYKDRFPEKLVTMRNAAGAVLTGLAVFAALYFVSGLYAADNRVAIPFVDVTTDTGDNQYTLLSFMHLADIVNLLLLLAPIPLGYLLFHRNKGGSSPRRNANVFFMLAIGFFCVFLFFANTVYGLGRDWDLAAPLGILFAIAAFHGVRSAARHAAGKAFLFSLLTVLYIMPWLSVNISLDGSKNRMGYLIELDVDNIFPYLSMIGYEALRKQYLHEKNYERELEYLIKMIRLQDHPDSYNLLESTLFTNYFTQKDTIVKYNKWMLHRLDSLAGAMQEGRRVYKWQNLKFVDSMAAGIGYYAYLNQRIDPMQEEIASIVEKRKLYTVLFVLNGMEAYRRTDFAQAAYFLGRTRENKFMTGKLAGMYGDALMQTGQDARSDSVFTAAFEEYPEDAELRVLRAFGLIHRGVRPADAERYLQEALALQPDDAMRGTIEALFNRLKDQ